MGGWNEQVRRKQHRVSGAIPVLFPNNLFILIGFLHLLCHIIIEDKDSIGIAWFGFGSFIIITIRCGVAGVS